MSQEALKSFLIFKNDGKVDRIASVNKFQQELTKFELNKKDRNDLVAVAIQLVFDQYAGQTLTKPALITFALKELQASAANWNMLEQEIISYLKANTGSNLSLYGMKSGQGYFRWSDQNAK